MITLIKTISTYGLIRVLKNPLYYEKKYNHYNKKSNN